MDYSTFARVLGLLQGWWDPCVDIETSVRGMGLLHALWAHYMGTWGAGIACWLDRQTRDRKVASSSICRSGGIIFFSRVNSVC